jgi:hypothetical protein
VSYPLQQLQRTLYSAGTPHNNLFHLVCRVILDVGAEHETSQTHTVHFYSTECCIRRSADTLWSGWLWSLSAQLTPGWRAALPTAVWLDISGWCYR